MARTIGLRLIRRCRRCRNFEPLQAGSALLMIKRTIRCLEAVPRMSPINRKWTSALNTLCRKPLTVATVFAVAMLSTTPCLALDYQPFDWVPAPPNTNIVMGYYAYGG